MTAQGFDAIALPAPAARDPIAASNIPHAAWAGVDTARDAAETIQVLADWAPGALVIDHYAFDAEWHRAVHDGLGCGIAAIDDLADRAMAAAVVVDQNYSRDHCAKFEGRLEPATILLGGPRFALLGPAFVAAPRHHPSEEVRSIGIFMGGVDERNLSVRALDAVVAAEFDGAVEIVTTSANPNLAALRAACEARPGTSISTDLPDLADFFARHDVQIGAGGGASWERCCIGAPTLLLVAADNQLAVVPELVRQHIVLSPEPLGTLDSANIAATLRRLISDFSLRRAFSERSRTLVDGLGARRVALRLVAGSLSVREATLADAEILHRWRNHPSTRSVSRDAREIGWEDHLVWLDRVLADPRRSLMVGMAGHLAVGVVRFDRLDGGSAEVSLYLDPALHGLGLGRAMLLAGEVVAAPGLDIHAEVLEGNIGSARLFKSAGYRRVDATHWIKLAKGRTQAN